MTSDLLGQSYYKKAQSRLKALNLFMQEEDYSDVVREAQEIIELILKGILRKYGIEPPEEYSKSDAERALTDVEFVFSWAQPSFI